VSFVEISRKLIKMKMGLVSEACYKADDKQPSSLNSNQAILEPQRFIGLDLARFLVLDQLSNFDELEQINDNIFLLKHFSLLERCCTGDGPRNSAHYKLK
jgi:hypothetical protein